ncbi:MAG TPA: glycosyltransferase family 39 protein [Gaiellaceae bacterium]|nr:glycosyltransferase family 39 protein [Gaiellaceae bacterium]
MSDSAEATTLRLRGVTSVRALVAARWFPLGVAAVALAAGAFFLARLTAWPPHEDETLALFVGRDSFPGMLRHVTHERGGAPLHFVLAWGVAHLGLGLAGLRLVSAILAVGSLVAGALLGARLASPHAALLGTTFAAASWVFLFHGVFGRMYSLFLLTSVLTLLALLRALDRGRRRDWALWAIAMLLCVASHPYGALVLAGQGLFVLLERRRLLRAGIAFACVLAAGTPFWLVDRRLAERFDVGVGGGGAQLGGPRQVAQFLWSSAGDFATGWRWPLLAIALVAAVGLAVVPRRTALLGLCLLAAPTAAFLAARLHSAASPQTRHLIFLLPLFSLVLAAGLLRLLGRTPVVLAVVAAGILAGEVGWAWHRTPQLLEGEPAARVAARNAASAWLATTARPDDVLLGYNPLYLGAWERNRDFSHTVVPRADVTLMLRVLERTRPLGRAVVVLDGSNPRNRRPTMQIAPLQPQPARAYEVRTFGPFLVARTRAPTGTPARFLERVEEVEALGRAEGLDETVINLDVVRAAQRSLDQSRSAGSRSISSR